MGQLKSTNHNESLNLDGYFGFAHLQPEVAFFIASRNLLKGSSLPFITIKDKFECPTNVPFHHFCNYNRHFYLDKSKSSQGICNPLLWFLGDLGSLLRNFFNGVIL
jgi:hypothetical protein